MDNVDMIQERLSSVRGSQGKGIEGPAAQKALYFIIIVTCLLAMLPILITALSSLKTSREIMEGVFSLPHTPMFSNWAVGFRFLSLNMLNSIIVCLVSTFGVVFLGSITAYVLTRHHFPGKEFIFYLIIAMLVIPGILTLTPSYLLMINLGIKNTWWALILPYISGGQIGAIFLFRTFFSQQPVELFEAARTDGANDFIMYMRITIPLAIPVIAIQAVGTFAGVYNDFLWPTLVIDEEKKQMLMPVLKTVTHALSQSTSFQSNMGAVHAIYLLSGIPLIITTALGLKYFINGDFASGLKL